MRFIVYKDRRMIGGITVTPATRDFLRSKGYRLVPA